ncbi:MAG: alpha/beta hydrolase [Pirellulaceae bacterium]
MAQESTASTAKPNSSAMSSKTNSSTNQNPKYFAVRKTGGVEFARGPGWRLKLDIYTPQGPGKFPAVVMFHGGAWAFGSKLNWRFHAQRLARQGFVVITPNYRLAPWHPFPAQIIDCRNAVRWTKANAERLQIDPEQIGAYGYSAGAHLALLLVTNHKQFEQAQDIPQELRGFDPSIKAVVAGGSPCDFDWVGDRSLALWYWLRATKKTNPDIFRDASPRENFSADVQTPIFFYHAEFDRVVPIASAQRLHKLTLSSGNVSKFITLKGKGHFQGFIYTKIVDDAADFLKENLAIPSGKNVPDQGTSRPVQPQFQKQ